MTAPSPSPPPPPPGLIQDTDLQGDDTNEKGQLIHGGGCGDGIGEEGFWK